MRRGWKRDHKAKRWMRSVLIRRAGGRCEACGDQVVLTHDAPKQATIDHVVPLALGGQHVLANMQLLCRVCNVAKGSTPPEYWTLETEAPDAS